MTGPHPPPAPLTTFVGRAAELRALSAALDASRLVTVTGPGGCGKTRLAAEVARTHAFPVAWADLAATGDPADVPGLVAAAAGEPIAGDDGAVAHRLAGRRLLLCLDNCEHVLTGAAELALAVLAAGPDVTILATGREPLGVPGERVWRVPSLTAEDALALFDERSGHAAVSAAARQAAHTACVRLDGIPLAIELAAAWSGTLSAEEILHGLDDRFALLVRGPRGVAARHRTLAASMAWSHDLLDERDQLLFRRLGVFHGGFTLATARSVCAADGLDATAVRDGLRRLVDTSMIIADTEGGTTRYRMLETIRQYAAGRLEAAGETDAVRDRHLDVLLALVEDAAPLLDRDKDAWRAAVAAERENLRAALAYGLARDDPDRGRRLAAGLAWMWHLTSAGHEGLAVLRTAIDRGAGERTATQARLLTALALVADTTRPFGLEYDAAQAALEIATETGDAASVRLATLLSAVGSLGMDLGTARTLAVRARALGEEDGDGFVADAATALLGIVAHLRDEHDAAMPLLRSAVDGLLPRGDRGVAATALAFLAASTLYTGDVDGARDLATEAVRTARPLADHHRLAAAGSVLAAVETEAGRFAAAHDALDPIVALVEAAETPPFVPGLTRTLGELLLREGRPGDAIGWFGREAAWLGGATADPTPHTLVGLAAAYRMTGDAEAAASAAGRALDGARKAGAPRLVAAALEQAALLDPDDAEDLHHEALAIRSEHGLRLYVPDSLSFLAPFLEPSAAIRLLAAADRAREESGAARPAVPLDRLRTGEDAYATAWSEGRALDLTAAVAYARRTRGKRGRPSTGWASLTPTEQEVVRLTITGLTNPEIATRLFISRATVKTHLSHIYAKLGVTNRTELAAVAPRP